jgi:hypothetical protein
VTAALLALVSASRLAAQPLPDVVAKIDIVRFPLQILYDQTVPFADVAEGCAGGTTGRTLIRFTLATSNVGTADVILGDPGCPPCFGEPPPTCANPLFECSVAEGHHHAHFSRYALYELIPREGAPAAATGHKQGFCIEDTLCLPRRYDCDFQGLSVGCTDAYFNPLGCQYVDATGVPGGRYLLRAEVNFARIIQESNYDNNVDEIPIELCDRQVQPKLRLAHGRWGASGRVVYAAPPLVDGNPSVDGSLVRLVLAGEKLLEVAVPGGGAGSGCDVRDGWTERPRERRAVYRNVSGFLDPACTVPAGGLVRLAITRTPEGFRYKAHGTLPETSHAPPATAETTVVLGSVTGPCGTGSIPSCVALPGAPGGLRCNGSPSGAFVDGEEE